MVAVAGWGERVRETERERAREREREREEVVFVCVFVCVCVCVCVRALLFLCLHKSCPKQKVTPFAKSFPDAFRLKRLQFQKRTRPL